MFNVNRKIPDPIFGTTEQRSLDIEKGADETPGIAAYNYKNKSTGKQ
jgi:hypothetical protein